MSPLTPLPLVGEVLITGGTGSLGQAIVRIAKENKWDCRFTIFSRDEMKQLAMQSKYPECRYVIGDVADQNTVRNVVAGHETVIHAAAFKHVPSGESNVLSMLNTNYQGSLNVALACNEHGVKTAIAISTDKACHPVNAYGASKLLMERIWGYFAHTSLTRFVCTRYGNVLGSTGSVLPVWRKMVEDTGEIKATSGEMTRFFFTLHEAVETILNANQLCSSGSIYIPKLKSIRMIDFREYIFPDVKTDYTGLRAGEKTYEELLTQEEVKQAEGYINSMIILPVSDQSFVFGRYFTDIVDVNYTSENCRRISKQELIAMVNESDSYQ